MKQSGIVDKTSEFIANRFANEGSGHDWFHLDRVRKLALRIGKEEPCDLFVVEMAALLHDLDDWKLTGSESPFPVRAKLFLDELQLEEALAGKILKVIEEVSYKGANVETSVSSKEAAVVQDADRLDAMGAIGIARTFSYGGHQNRLIYDPAIVPVLHDDYHLYKKSVGPAINHFYEKLLLLKDRMNTSAAKKIAVHRHTFMLKYLEQFFDEWEAKK